MKRKNFFSLLGLIFLSIVVVLGGYFVSSERSFDERGRVAEKKKDDEVIRFAVAGDGHYGANGPSGVDYVERHRRMIDWLNTEAADSGLDFVVFNGDLVNDDVKFIPLVKEWYDKLHVPYYVVHGNHDMGDWDKWEEFWGTGYDFDFEYKGYGFVCLGTGYENRRKHYSDRYWNYDFLVERSQYYIKQNKPVFVITHISFDHNAYGGNDDGVYGPEAQKYHDYIRSQPLIEAGIFSHRHNRRGVRNYDNQVYFYTGPFAHRPAYNEARHGYRVFEISTETGQFRSYFVDGLTKAKEKMYTSPVPESTPLCGSCHEMVFPYEQDDHGDCSICAVGNVDGSISYPSPGEKVEWKCVNPRGEVDCWARREGLNEPPPPPEPEPEPDVDCLADEDCRREVPYEICLTSRGFCLRGDVNNDGVINMTDFDLFKQDFASFKKSDGDDFRRSDFNIDGRISMADYSIFVKSYLVIRGLD